MSELQTTTRPRRPRPAVVTLTDAAAERVRALTEAGGHKALRVGLKNAGCAGQEYTFAFADEIGPLDEVVTDKGATVVVDPKAILFLIGSEIDYETTKLASKFVFRNPNQTDACGCGESVTIVPVKAVETEEQAD
ncbi:MAG: iron-sulfur cluster assembly accessory protein [Brevundimonas sp.]|uniref:HesB/IscA family protein n=1 Tax=Brevundimonas sp. TaxID=1871086 RepID=UPI001A1F0A2F|nr:iron-sulfur cluster assembly accessory protein [Brevundimonas sp.]MBJ7447095.1 iron-sulfur cluster assembly accessory protein [Brevundimonas sp.]